MTIIVCGNRRMVADSRATTAGTIERLEISKLKRLSNGGIAGFAGNVAKKTECILKLEQVISGEAHWHEIAPEGEYSLIYLSPGNRLTHLDSEGSFRVKEPYAIGSGFEIAYGALDAGASLEDAVKIAINRNIFCGGAIQVMALNDKG